VWFEVSDGVQTDTLDLSRKVRNESLGSYILKEEQWVPLRVKGELGSSALNDVFAPLNGEGSEWQYDPIYLRVFRWGAGQWMEYSPQTAADFALSAGKVVWVKSREARTLEFGAGSTAGLKEPTVIDVPAQSWVDFSSPFAFDVYLWDVLAGSGPAADSLQFCYWRRSEDGESYEAEDLYTALFPRFDEARDTAVFRAEPLHDAYSVYNPADAVVQLKLPPTPLVLSKKPAAPLSKRRTTEVSGWDVAVHSTAADGERLNTVLCGVNRGLSQSRYLPLRPTFRKAGVAVSDEETQKLYAHAAAAPASDEGGMAWPLVCYNDGSSAMRITSSVDAGKGLPAGYSASLVATDAAAEGEGSVAITVPSGGQRRMHLVVGTDAYRQQFSRRHINYKLGLAGVYPNPLHGPATIRYTVPLRGVEQLEFAVYDLHGRMVWRKELADGVQPGTHSLIWDGKDLQGKPVGSGRYVIRMRGRTAGKRKEAVHEMSLLKMK
jgi:hypothetical protein